MAAMKRLACVVLALLLFAGALGCGTLYPRTTIEGGEAAGEINRDEAFDLTIEPAGTVPATEPAPDDGEWIVDIIVGGKQ